MRTFLIQTNPSCPKQCPYHAITSNKHNTNKKNTNIHSNCRNRRMSNSNSVKMNELRWLRRMSSSTLKRQRTHTEETVTESQDEGEEEDIHDDEEVALESPISSSTLSFLDSTQKTTGNNHRIKKSVSFCNTVSVHHHPLILGDHPAVRNGVPLMLDWTALYSEERHLRDKSSSKTLVPALSLYVREVLAQQAGATKDEMCAAREQVRAIQSSRQQSMAYKRWWPWPRWYRVTSVTLHETPMRVTRHREEESLTENLWKVLVLKKDSLYEQTSSILGGIEERQ